MRPTRNTLSENIRAQSVELLNKHLAPFGQSIREAIGQATSFGGANTADLFTEISHGIDQQLWFVESHSAHK